MTAQSGWARSQRGANRHPVTPRCDRAQPDCAVTEPSLVTDTVDPAHAYRCSYPVGLTPAHALGDPGSAHRDPRAD